MGTRGNDSHPSRGTSPTARSVAERQQLLLEAKDFLFLFHQECELHHAYLGRVAQVQEEIERTGTYWHTYEELAFGARVAWRNSSRCIGRLYWKTLQVVDRRHLATEEEIFQALVEHIQLATNGGKIEPMMTIFRPSLPRQATVRIWNPQLIRYAGYRQPDGSVVGDPLHVELTEVLRRLGWQGGEGGPFDMLPLAIQLSPHPPKLFELPPEQNSGGTTQPSRLSLVCSVRSQMACITCAFQYAPGNRWHFLHGSPL